MRSTVAGIPVFGPSAAAARIESSKAFCHEVAGAAGVRMARAGAFTELVPALAFAQELDARPATVSSSRPMVWPPARA